MNTIDLNIQPAAYEIYGMFQNLSYTEWTALAEFIDNSTASFYANEDKLINAHSDTLLININYDKDTDTLTIDDDAYGMELEEFQRAILLGKKPPVGGSRNEFGMGLKTAASWFGKRWSVESTQYGSENYYYASLDIDDLIEHKSNSIKILKGKDKLHAHGTKITINKLNKELNGKRIKNKIISILNDTYRRDLQSGKIEIIFNGTSLSFDEIPVLESFRGKDWKKNLDFSFDYLGKVYNVTGFVGIMDKGSFIRSGFALFRRDRVIIPHYKPLEIFQQIRSQIDLKLFGELNLDSFNINQAKDGFQWSGDLEEYFIENLKNSILEYIDVAKMKVSEIKEEKEQSMHPVSAVTPTDNQWPMGNTPSQIIEEPSISIAPHGSYVNEANPIEEDNEHSIAEAISNTNYTNIQYHNNTVEHSNSIKLCYKEQLVEFEWKPVSNKYFLYFKEKENYVINMNHKFAEACPTNSRVEVSKIIYAYILSEEIANKMAFDGFASTTILHNKISEILNDIKEA